MIKNDKNQAIQISTEISNNIGKGVFEIELYNGTKEIVRVISVNSSLSIDKYSCTVTTFKTDIDSTMTFDIYDIKSANCLTL